MRRAHAVVAFMLGLASAHEARAAGSGIALDQFDPTPAGDAFFAVPSPFARGNWVPRATLMFDYADQPLVLTPTHGLSGAVVNRQAFFDVNASITIQDRLLVSVLLPVAVVQDGDSPDVASTKLASPSGAQLGDVRVGMRVRMIGDDTDPFQLGLGANLYTPTAKSSSFAGEGATRVEPQLLAGGRFRAGITWIYTAFGGVMVRPSHNPTTIVYGAGLAASLWEDRMQLGAEGYASTPIQGTTFSLTDSVTIPTNASTNAELLFSAKVRMFRDLFVGWAAGPGLTQAIGTPSFRIVGAFGWAPGLPHAAVADPDTDGDGIPDVIDACPYAAGPRSRDPLRNGCPTLDDDEDGIPNAEDACPTRWGVRTSDPKTNGCPPESRTRFNPDAAPEIPRPGLSAPTPAP